MLFRQPEGAWQRLTTASRAELLLEAVLSPCLFILRLGWSAAAIFLHHHHRPIVLRQSPRPSVSLNSLNNGIAGCGLPSLDIITP